jgi:alpha-galactosidase
VSEGSARVVYLRRGGTSVLARLGPDDLPVVLHWGPDLGELPDHGLDAVVTALGMPHVDSVVMTQEAVSVLPRHSAGWIGRPGLSGSRAGRAWSVRYDGGVGHDLEETAPGSSGEGAVRLTSVATDATSGLEVTTELELCDSGLLRLRAAVRNLGAEVYEVGHLEPALPVPAEAGELLDMAGRHTHEREPQRRPFDLGQWVREAWGGRPGHDSATVLCAGRPGFGFRTGRVWGVHLAWSGNQVLSAEHSSTGWRLLRGGELLLPGEVRLGPGEHHRSPWLTASWGEGLDELSSRFHRHLRARPQHPRTPRKVLLNTWEAVHFDLDLDKLIALAERAAEIGIERYVLDDGWFRHRRDDRAGLGDWYVDESVFPDGLRPLVDRIHELGLDFGLWFEPEAVSPDSDLARAHPEWILQTEHGPGVESRFQQVLDLGHQDAYVYVLDRMSALVAELDVAFVKWDHNRALVDAGHSPTGAPGVHVHTEAAYRLMDELKARHNGLEIESCCGGGGRLDLGMIDHADRVWVSDCIDAHERHRLVRWTGLTLPPELMGTHVGSAPDHSTGRVHDLSFRAGTALWGHLGVEADLTELSAADLAVLASWIAFHKDVRDLLHHGDVVRADPVNPALSLDGVVAADRGDALYRLSALDHTVTWPAGRVTLPGLDPDVLYHVRAQAPGGDAVRASAPAWAHDGVVLSGRVLGEVGIHAPLLDVDRLVLLRARRER